MSKPSLSYYGIVTAALFAATSLSACANPSGQAAAARPVLSALVEPAGDERGLVTGVVRSTASHEIAAEAPGRVLRLAVDVGDRVRAGQVMAELDAEPARLLAVQAAAQAAAAKSELGRAESEAQRQARLAEVGATSVSTLETARVEAATARRRYEAATSQADLANRNLKLAVVRAPMDGVVSARHVQLSSLATAGAALFSLDGDGALEILAPAPTGLLASLQPGATAGFRIGATKGLARLEGVSARVAGVDAQMARFRVLSGPAPIGAVVELDLRGRAAAGGEVQVPLSAVVSERKGARHVLLIDAGRLKPVPVTLISVTAGGATVRGDLKPGQSVVAAGAELLAAGDLVRPLPHAS